ncbi:serine hydrolase [Myxosarcina sp. GI1]|uniref:serine hydrolase n=1 Tax=Myxosarcina sp. GI1 TaxID=1541065 RepID=UPI000A9E917A|nr:serine hydrolase [Myxosarcina sp. GI1]
MSPKPESISKPKANRARRSLKLFRRANWSDSTSAAVNRLSSSNHQQPKSRTRQKFTADLQPRTAKHPTTFWHSRFRASPLYIPFLVTLNLAVIAVGLSTILGTTISIANSLQVTSPQDNVSPDKVLAENADSNTSRLEKLFPIAELGKEIPALQAQLEDLAAQYPQLEPKVFLADLDTQSYVSIDGQTPLSSASTIKLPILIAFFQDVDAGKIDLQEELTITEEVVGGGSGGMQYEPIGTKYTALETVTLMITVSDNTATNMLIERLGGQAALNQRFIDLGLTATRLQNPLPDLTGTNTTSTEDLGNLLVQLARGELVSIQSRDRLLLIMRSIVRNTLLPEGLEAGAIIAHKTGDIKSVLGDAGIIDMPNGKRYIASVLVKRPDNDPQAKEFIQQMSHLVYQYFTLQPTDTFTN